jgi:hypothetical protein
MRHTVKTILSPQETFELAQTFFGPAGKGLTMTSQRKRALRWQDGKGYVDLIVKGEAPTFLEIDTNTQEDAVQEFIARLPQERSWWARLWRRITPSASPTLSKA